MKYRLAFVIFCACYSAHCQDMFHSPYSVFGLGIMSERSSSLNRAMGGSGIAVQDDRKMNHMNPAAYAAIAFPVTHSFEIGTYLEYNQYRTQRYSESNINGGLTNLSYWFRFRPWYGSAVGIAPLSSVSYNISAERAIAVGQDAPYIYKGNGNLTSIFWGHGFNPLKNLYLGATASYVFGSVHRTETLLSDNASEMLTLDNKTFGSEFQFDVGLQYKVNMPVRALIFGATYTSGMTLEGKNTYLLQDINRDTLADYKGREEVYEVAEKFGVGVGLKGKRSVFSADLTFSPWSAVTASDEDVSYRDSWKVAAGYAHNGNEFAESYWGLMGFRFGIHWQDHYLVVKQTPLRNWGGSAGVSLPVADGRSMINVTYSFDRMGTTANDLILHTSGRIQVDIVILDVWRKRRKLQ